MKFTQNSANFQNIGTDCLIVGLFSKESASETLQTLDPLCNHFISELLEHGDFTAKLGQTLIIHNHLRFPALQAQRVLLVGCGEVEEFTEFHYHEALQAGFCALEKTGAKQALCTLPLLPLKERSLEWKVQQLITIANLNQYKYHHTKSGGNDTSKAE